MKKLISITLVLSMILTMCACGAKKDDANSGAANSEAVSSETASSVEVATEAASSEEASSEEAVTETASNDDTAAAEQTEAATDEVIVRKIGVLTMLNMTEEEMVRYRDAMTVALITLHEDGYAEKNYSPVKGPNIAKREIVFYDSMDAMLMALNAGDIGEMMVYDKVGQYLCATDDSLKPRYIVDTEKERNTFANIVLSGNLSNNFAFLMMEDNEALRDEFSSAIKDMKDDGTMDKLVKEQIDTLINGGEAKAISMPEIEGADTIKVAVTGSLPPMDYVAADGTPAGFNTAVLAEISQRIGKNIELVVVDSIGRATALSSGTVDAVFWTRTNEAASAFAEMSEEERAAEAEKNESEMTDEEIEAHRKIGDLLSDFDHYNTADMPEGTICTVPYYSDILMVVLKK